MKLDRMSRITEPVYEPRWILCPTCTAKYIEHEIRPELSLDCPVCEGQADLAEQANQELKSFLEFAYHADPKEWKDQCEELIYLTGPGYYRLELFRLKRRTECSTLP